MAFGDGMASAEELAGRLSEASVRKTWDVYTAFDWPERLEPDAHWYMSPELISIHGTEPWEQLGEPERKRLSFYEIVNFFASATTASQFSHLGGYAIPAASNKAGFTYAPPYSRLYSAGKPYNLPSQV